MITPFIPSNIQFRVETLFTKNGGRVGKIRCDEHGIYRGLPLMVLGEVTQQKTYYDPQTLVDQITNPNTRFNMCYRANKLYGEWGHPQFYGLDNNEKIERLTTVEEKNISHLFTGLYTDPPAAGGTVVVRGDIKPTGPMGQVLKESLEDPIVNTAFSLRAYVDTKMRPDGVKYRQVKSLVTWDVVGASGYKSTDKANSLGLENFASDTYHEYEINVMKDGNLLIDQIALEKFTDSELNEIFGQSVISKIIQSRSYVKADPNLIERFPNLYKQSLFHDYFKEI